MENGANKDFFSIWQAALSLISVSISLSTVLSLELAEENIGKICATESK